MHEMLYQYRNMKQKILQIKLHILYQNQNENLVKHLDKINVNFRVLFEINMNKLLPKQQHELILKINIFKQNPCVCFFFFIYLE